ncbi:MAG: Pantoea phage vB PagS Vid5 [Pseudomonadota bacterium]|jgi:hypothetical protein
MGFQETADNDLNRMALLIVAESGVGKTSQCMNLSPDEVAFISLESGDLCFKKNKYKPRLKSVIKTVDDLTETFIELSKGIKGIRYVFIDSITEMGQMVLSELKADSRYVDPKFALKMYGEYNDTMTKIIKSYRDMSQYTVIFTCLSSKEKDGMESYDEFNIPGSSVKNNLKAYFDLVLHMKAYKDDDGEKRIFLTNSSVSRLAKDRSGLLLEVENANIGELIAKILE